MTGPRPDPVAGEPGDVELCVALWTRVIAARDGGADASVAERARAAFTLPIIRFAVAGRPILGFALTVVEHPGAVTLSRLAVDTGATSRGLGAALIADAVAQASAAGHTRIDLEVRVANARAMGLYSRLGFRAVSEPHPFDAGDPMVTWARDLRPAGGA